MGDEGCSINLALGYEFQNFLAIAAIYASCLESEILAIHLRERQHLRFIIEGNYCHDGIWTCTLPCELEGVVGSCHFENSVSTAMVAVLDDEVLALFRICQKDRRIMLTNKLASFLRFLTYDDALWIL